MSEQLGKYRLLRHLATGGMGEVFLAEHEGPQSFRKRVVVKRLLRHLASDPAFVDMFLEEARVAALIAHPNVAHIIELGHLPSRDGAESDTYFIVMEHVRGASLRDLLRKLQTQHEVVPPKVACAIVADVLRGLHAAHTLVDDDGLSRGCVHRDVSAENVLLSVDGAIKLVDFGIAKALDATTARGTMLRGKYGYMAPEQYLRKKIDARTDVFACGVLLHELIAGARPFAGDNDGAVMHAVLEDAPRPLPAAARCSKRLQDVIARALAKHREARFESAEAMASALDELVAQDDVSEIASNMSLRDFARRWIDAERASDMVEAAPAGPRTAPLQSEEQPANARARQPPPSRRAMLIIGGAALVVMSVTFAVARRSSPPGSTEVVTAPTPSPSSASSSAAVDASAAAPSVAPDATRAPDAPVAPVAPNEPERTRSPHATSKRPLTNADKLAGMGTLAFRVRPWAEIFVDGKSLGVSPVSPVEMAAGKHRVVLRNKELGKEKALSANIVRGETTTLKADLFE